MFTQNPYNPFGAFQQSNEVQISPTDPQTGAFRYTRFQFNMAGQKSFSSPPAQDQDSFIQLYNTMPVTVGSLDRRWGIRPFAGPFDSFGGRRVTAFQNNSLGQRSLIYSNSVTAILLDETDGSTQINPLFTFNGSAQPRFLISRDQIYATNGQQLFKHSGIPGQISYNWGIDAANTTVAAINTRFPGLGTQDLSSFGTSWIMPSNIVSTNSTYCTVGLPANPGGASVAKMLEAEQFGFGADLTSLSAVTGVKVTIRGHVDSTGTNAVRLTVGLLKNGVAVGVSKAIDITSTGDADIVLGASNDLWGATWTYKDFVNTAFGVYVVANSLFGTVTRTISIDSIKVTLYASSSAITIGSKSVGNVTLTSGRKYACVFKNSATGHYGDLNTPSGSTGALTDQQQALSNIPVSNQGQVDSKVLLATADGGDTSKWYFLDELANATTTYTDNTRESDLLLANVYQETDEEGVEHGVALNSPPPNASIFCKHRGRLYALIESTLYYSKNLDDLTTSTGLIAGKYEEAWPGDFQLDISDQAETGSALLSDGINLYIGTERHIRRLIGDGPQNFQEPDVIFNNVGVVSQEVMQVVYVEDQPVGAMWLTPELKVMLSDFNTYNNVGEPIQDVLNSINRSHIDRCYAQYFGSGVYSFYALAITTGTNTDNDTVCIFDLNKHKWHVWTFPVSVLSMYYNIQSDGTPRLLIGGFIQPSTGILYTLDPTTTTDQATFTANPQLIPVTIKTPWLYFGDHNARKDFNEIEVFTPDAQLALGIVAASNSNEFAAPTVVATAMNLTISPFGEYKFYLASKQTRDRYYQLTFGSNDTANRVVLDGFRAEIIPEHRI